LLDAEDTRVMREALERLGVPITERAQALSVHGAGGVFPAKKADLFLGNAGTALRPLTAALALSEGEYFVSGVPRMHERPIGDLVDALRASGARIDYRGKPGFPPLVIHPAKVRRPRHRISLPPARLAAARCAWKASAARASRATCASPKCCKRWARPCVWTMGGSSAQGAASSTRSTSTSITFPMPR